MVGRQRSAKRERASLLDAILNDPSRDRLPLVRPVVSIGEDEERAYLDEVKAHLHARVELERRGVWHGEWAVLDAEKRTASARLDGIRAQRWHAARPIVLPGILARELADLQPWIEDALERQHALQEPGGLRAWLAEDEGLLAESFVARTSRAKAADPERDLERVDVESLPLTADGRRVKDLWIKSGWLSTHADDASLRVRFSFGRERDDDASRDILRHRLVAELAGRLLPESDVIASHPELNLLLDRWCGEATLLTQHIAYWNAPHGGALFHHDAFAEDAFDGGSWRQLGVCYVQLSGATAWLALSTDDLVTRLREFASELARGALPWVRAQLFERTTGGFERFLALALDDEHVVRELALPGQGELGALVNRGPEFTAFLADAGHGYVLEAGDAIVLPNQGFARTCMHSVFCASEETAYSLSLAIRPDREAPEKAAERAESHTKRSFQRAAERDERRGDPRRDGRPSRSASSTSAKDPAPTSGRAKTPRPVTSKRPTPRPKPSRSRRPRS